MRPKSRPKQSSTLSANFAIDVLRSAGFNVATVEFPFIPKSIHRKAVLAVRNKFGYYADVSRSGESICFEGPNLRNRELVKFFMPVSGMITNSALGVLRLATGLSFTRLITAEDINERIEISVPSKTRNVRGFGPRP